MIDTETPWRLTLFSSSSSSFGEELRKQIVNGSGGGSYYWATLLALLFIIVWHFSRHVFSRRTFGSTVSTAGISSSSAPSPPDTQSRIEIISDEDLKGLIQSLNADLQESDKWENVIDKRNDLMSYSAKCCKPKDGPVKYLSITVFEDCSPEVVRDFYMDNDYRLQWDNTLVQHEQVQVDTTTGIEIGRTIKKFPLLTPREYLLAWRLWEGKDNSFYCFIKECEHSSAPRQRKYVRVGCYRSGWRIRKVPGRNACEIRMLHQEDAGLNVEMAKLAFAKGVWKFVCKMDSALRKYSPSNSLQTSPAVSAVTLIKKVPLELEAKNSTSSHETATVPGPYTVEAKKKKISLRKPSKKFIANGLLLLGGAVCLSRGHSNLGAKIAMAYFLTKLSKHSNSSGQGGQSQGN